MNWAESGIWNGILILMETFVLTLCTWYFLSHTEQNINGKKKYRCAAIFLYWAGLAGLTFGIQDSLYINLVLLVYMVVMTILTGSWLYNRKGMYCFYYFLFPVTLVTVQIFVIFSGCAGSRRLSDQFDEEEVKKAAEEVIEILNSGDIDALVEEKWSTVMKNALDEDGVKDQILPIIEELGGFEGFDQEAVTGGRDADTEQEFAVAVIKAKYEKRKAQFTISFDEDMKVAGFFIK